MEAVEARAGAREIAAHVTSRPCLYVECDERGGVGELIDRPVYAAARGRVARWVNEKLAGGLTTGITMGMSEYWVALAREVADGGARRAELRKKEERAARLTERVRSSLWGWTRRGKGRRRERR